MLLRSTICAANMVLVVSEAWGAVKTILNPDMARSVWRYVGPEVALWTFILHPMAGMLKGGQPPNLRREILYNIYDAVSSLPR